MVDQRDSDSPYGVLSFLSWNHDWNNYFFPDEAAIRRAAELMDEAGIRFTRVDFLWGDLEPERGRFDFSRYDAMVRILDDYHIRLLGILHYNPLWHTGAWNSPPDKALYTLFASAVVRHFKDRIKYWEIWNEPDHEVYWHPQDEMTTYSQLLRAVYPAIKKEDPTAQILVGSLSDRIPFKLRWIYQKAGRAYFDLVNIHPFVPPLASNAVTALHTVYSSVTDVMNDFDDADKPIWFTEIGCPGVPDNSQTGGWWLGEIPSQEQQAQWVTAVYQNALQWKNVQKIFWAFFRDTKNHFQNSVDHFGLVREDFTPKPAYHAYKKLTSSPPHQAVSN